MDRAKRILRNFSRRKWCADKLSFMILIEQKSILHENDVDEIARWYEVRELRIFHSHKILDINIIDEWTSRFVVRAIAMCIIPRSRPLTRCVAV